MELRQTVLGVGFTDDEEVLGYVDVAYTNACTDGYGSRDSYRWQSRGER